MAVSEHLCTWQNQVFVIEGKNERFIASIEYFYFDIFQKHIRASIFSWPVHKTNVKYQGTVSATV